MALSITDAMMSPIVQIVDIDKNTSIPISIFYGASTNYKQGKMVAKMAINNSLVEDFNTKNGTSYLVAPEGSVTLSKNSLTIEDGNKVSDQLNLVVHGEQIDFLNQYLIPVTIESVTEGKLSADADYKTIYYLIEGNLAKELNRKLWTLVASSSSLDVSYGAELAWDGDRKTYWHTAHTGMPQWYTVDMKEYKLIDGFSWVNRQDGYDSFPKHIMIETSVDGLNWTTAYENEALDATNFRQILELEERVIARFFKVTILSNWMAADFTFVADVDFWCDEAPEVETNWEVPEYDFETGIWRIHSFSSEWNVSWAASHVLDGNTATSWHTDPFDTNLNGMPQWFIVDMRKIRPGINGIKVLNRQDDSGLEPKHVVVSVSEDLSNWSVILDLPEMSNSKTFLTYDTTKKIPGRYLKFEVKSNWGGGAWTYLAEFSVY